MRLAAVFLCLSIASSTWIHEAFGGETRLDEDLEVDPDSPRHLTNEQASFFQSTSLSDRQRALPRFDVDELVRRMARDNPALRRLKQQEYLDSSTEASSSQSQSQSSSASVDDDENAGGEEEEDEDGSSEYYDDDDDDDDDSEESSGSGSDETVPRLLSQSAFNRISETLGALNHVGHLLVDMTRGGHDTKNESGEASAAAAASSVAVTATAATSVDAPAATPTGKILGPLPASQNNLIPGGGQGVRQVADKRVGQEEPSSSAPMFVETKETKKKKKKKNNKNKQHKVKKPAATHATDGSNKTPATLRPAQLVAATTPATTTTTTMRTTTTSRPLDDQIALASEDASAKDAENRCKTPSGRPGRCEDLSSCPALLLNLSSLRESLCFKSLFVPGVCCPIPEGSTVLTTQRPLRLTTRAPPSTTSSTTSTSLSTTSSAPTTKRPPTKRPSNAPNLILIPQIKPSTTTTTTPAPLPVDLISNELDNNIVDPEECGQQEYSSGRIVGGVEAPNGQWPWMAAIFLHGPKRTEFWCGGSLIGSKYILTAAHCTRDSRQKPFAARQFTVRLGDIDLSTDAEPSAPVTFGVKEVRAHERFSRIGFYNDIAILVLDKPVRKSKYVIPVCLPRAGRMPPKERLPGRRATVVGWGTTYYGGKESTSQRQAELPIWRNEDCDRSYFQPINENFICAGYSDGGVDACQGDSGGPLMMRYDSRWIQLGVVSFGNKCGEPGYPGVYTRVTQYLDWIQDHTRD